MANAGDIRGTGVSDIIVGAPGQNRVYIFSGSRGTLLRILRAPGAQLHASFGSALAAGKDLNGDGVPDIVVGAPLHHVGSRKFEGRVFVISGADGLLIRVLEHPSPQPFARFGAAVALVPDVDGRVDVLVGAPDQNVKGLPSAGQAFLFSGADGRLLQTLDDTMPQAYGSFGYAVAAADLDGDGGANPLVSAPFQNVNSIEDEIPVPHVGQGQVFAFVQPHSNTYPPVATSMSVTTSEDIPASFILTGSDPDGDCLTFSITEKPINGTLTGLLPRVTYTPDRDFHGTDSFRFRVNDGQNRSSPAGCVANFAQEVLKGQLFLFGEGIRPLTYITVRLV